MPLYAKLDDRNPTGVDPDAGEESMQNWGWRSKEIESLLIT